jgi:hypothetical protein
MNRIMIDMNLRERQTKQAIKSGGSVCHSLLSEDAAARPPVKATLRLASLGLDRTRPTPHEATERREWQNTNGQQEWAQAGEWKTVAKNSRIF